MQGIAWLTGQSAAVAEWKANAEGAFGAARDLAKDGMGDLGTAMDLVTGKVDPLNGKTKQMEESARAAADAEQKRKDVMKAAVGAIDSYAKSLSNLGKEQMKVAENGFSRDLQRQEEYFKKNRTLATNLAAPLKNYLGVVDSVYQHQLTAQESIAKVLKDIGAEKKAQMEQQTQILQVEKSQAEASLKGWNDYLGKLKSMHSQAMEDIKKKQDELLALQDFGKETQKALQEKFFPKAPEADPFLQFFQKLEAADASQAAAMELTGDKRIEAIKKSIELLKALPEEVTEGDDVLISRQEVYEKIATRAQEWQSEAEAAKQAQLETSKTAAQILAQEMTRAEEAMTQLEQKIVQLDGKILSLSRVVTLTLDDQVTPGLETVRKALEGLVNSSMQNGTRVTYVNSIPGAVSLDAPSSYALDSYAKGTEYVPKTGLYELHQGEAVLTVEQNRVSYALQRRNEAMLGKEVLLQRELNAVVAQRRDSNTGGGLTIAPGAIQLIVQGGGNVDVDSMVDALSRKLFPKLDEYARRRRAA